MVDQSVNEFYTEFLFKIDALPQDAVFLLDIAANLFNNLSPNVREFLISEGIQVHPRTPTKTNHQRYPTESYRRLHQYHTGFSVCLFVRV